MTAHYNELSALLFSNKRFLAIAILYFVGISLIFTQVTHALFTDSASSSNNTFTAATVFPTGGLTPTPINPPNHLVINEISSDGSASAEWVELYNPTASSIDVSGWTIEDGISTDVLPSASPIPANSYAVIIGSGSIVSVPGSAQTITLNNSDIGSGLNEGGDFVRLTNTSAVVVDSMSYGTNTTIFPTPPAAPNLGQSVSRNPNGTDTDTAADWILDNSPSIGVSN